MSSQYNDVNSVRVSAPNWKDDDSFDALLVFLCEYRDCVQQIAFFSSGFHPPQPLETAAVHAAILRDRIARGKAAGFSCGVNVLSTIGHHPERLDEALRYAGGWYYMICLEALPCQRYAPYIYRTKDFDRWEAGFHNPVMMYGDDDRKVKPGCVLTTEEQTLLETGLNINCSDLDLCEYRGKTRIFCANGDQMTYSFLCEAEYDGPLEAFLAAFFQ